MDREDFNELEARFTEQKSHDLHFMEEIKRLYRISKHMTMRNLFRRLGMDPDLANECQLDMNYTAHIVLYERRGRVVYLYRDVAHGNLLYNGKSRCRLDTNNRKAWPFVPFVDVPPPYLTVDCLQLITRHLRVRDVCAMMRVSRHYRCALAEHVRSFWRGVSAGEASTYYEFLEWSGAAYVDTPLTLPPLVIKCIVIAFLRPGFHTYHMSSGYRKGVLTAGEVTLVPPTTRNAQFTVKICDFCEMHEHSVCAYVSCMRDTGNISTLIDACNNKQYVIGVNKPLRYHFGKWLRSVSHLTMDGLPKKFALMMTEKKKTK